MSTSHEGPTSRSPLARAAHAFPRGGLLPLENWRRRHLALTLVLMWHFPPVLAYGLYRGYPVPHALVDSSVPLLLGCVAFWPRLKRGARSVAVASGLISYSMVLVHLSHGLVEMHFHFFVVVALLTLYQDWKPFLVAIGLTVVEHGVMGVLQPQSVYNHPDAWRHPWRWAFVHGGFVVAASLANITAWAMAEADHRRHKADTARLHAERVAMLSHEAYHDMLTGLPNRRLVLDHLPGASARARRNGQALGVLFVDLDRFKRINDTYGHLVGDDVLRATADRLRGAVRVGELAARLGGDEFVVVLEGLTDPASLEAAADRVDRAVNGPVHLPDGTLVELVASVGRVLADEGESWLDLLVRADRDMYRVKHLAQGIGGGAVRIPAPR